MRYLVTNQTSFFERFTGYTITSLKEALDKLEYLEWVGVDTETTGKNCHIDKIMLCQLGNHDIQVVIDMSSFNSFPKLLKEFLERKQLILQNAKFDIKFFFSSGVIPTKVYDTMLTEQLLTNGDPQAKANLAALAKKYCQLELDKSIREELVKQFAFTQGILDYAAMDVVTLEKIRDAQIKELKAYNMMGVANIENNFVVVLAYIEWCGIKLDTNKWKERIKLETIKKNEAFDDLLKYMDQNFPEYFSQQMDLFSDSRDCLLNFNSPAQVKELFKKAGINVHFKEKGKVIEAIDFKHLQGQIKDFVLLQKYFNFKKAMKQLSTYGENWFKYINPNTLRVHTEFKQLANTGRLKCGNVREGLPNIQNLPHDAFTRSCFIAEPGNKIIATDYSAQEAIVLANFSREPNLHKFYRDFPNASMHSYVASLIFEELANVPLDDIEIHHRTLRGYAKNVGFSLAYGGGASTIAKNCGISKEKGEEIYNSYFSAFPELKKYFDNKINIALQAGAIVYNNIDGRKLFIQNTPYWKHKNTVSSVGFDKYDPRCRQIWNEYNESLASIQRTCMNYPIQGELLP